MDDEMQPVCVEVDRMAAYKLRRDRKAVNELFARRAATKGEYERVWHKKPLGGVRTARIHSWKAKNNEWPGEVC